MYLGTVLQAGSCTASLGGGVAGWCPESSPGGAAEAVSDVGSGQR